MQTPSNLPARHLIVRPAAASSRTCPARTNGRRPRTRHGGLCGRADCCSSSPRTRPTSSAPPTPCPSCGSGGPHHTLHALHQNTLCTLCTTFLKAVLHAMRIVVVMIVCVWGGMWWTCIEYVVVAVLGVGMRWPWPQGGVRRQLRAAVRALRAAPEAARTGLPRGRPAAASTAGQPTAAAPDRQGLPTCKGPLPSRPPRPAGRRRRRDAEVREVREVSEVWRIFNRVEIR